MSLKLKNASIIVATHNRADILEKTLNAMINQDFPGEYEIIVVNDASADNTKKVLQKFSKDVTAINLEKNLGPAAARNKGIEKVRYTIVVIMDDDCIPTRNWLKDLISGFSNNIGITTSFSVYGGTSTAFLKEALDEAGYFDENFPFEYREDTDLVFRVLDRGYEMKFIENARFEHLHKRPGTLMEKIRYILKRIWIHQVDPLLYKKHPERTKEFLKVKYGFLVSPKEDLFRAIGKWHEKGKLKLGSPQAIVFISGKTIFHKIAIVFFGLLYLISVKIVRLYGSIKYKKLLI